MSALVLFLWGSWAAFVGPVDPQPTPAPVVESSPVAAVSVGEVALVSAYTCQNVAANPMAPCNVTRWGSNPHTRGAACPTAWARQRVFVAGEWWLCDDTPRHDFIYGLPHIDLRLPTYQAAVEWGIRYERVRIE